MSNPNDNNNSNNRRYNWTSKRREKSRSIREDSKTMVSTKSKQEDEDKLKQRAQRFAKKSNSQTYGLVSRGEEMVLQLNKHHEREKFFGKIKKDFLIYCGSYDDVERLKNDMNNVLFSQKSEQKSQLEGMLMNLRKLREALLNSEPTDFTVQVYLYSIKVASRIGHYQTYVPCIYYLIHSVLENENSNVKLSNVDLEDVITIYVIHLCHFKLSSIDKPLANCSDISNAYKILNKFCSKNYTLKDLIQSVVQNNYIKWFQIYANELHMNLSFRCILKRSGLKTVIINMLLVINSTYYKLPQAYLENKILSRMITYHDLKLNFPDYCNSWQLTNGIITIRDRTKK